jgi:hypothetical protein
MFGWNEFMVVTVRVYGGNGKSFWWYRQEIPVHGNQWYRRVKNRNTRTVLEKAESALVAKGGLAAKEGSAPY